MKKSLFAVVFLVILFLGSAFVFKEAFATLFVNFYFKTKSLPVTLTVSEIQSKKAVLSNIEIGKNTVINEIAVSSKTRLDKMAFENISLEIKSLDPKDLFIFALMQSNSDTSNSSPCKSLEPLGANISIESIFLDEEIHPINLKAVKEKGDMTLKLDLRPTMPLLKNLEMDIGYRCDRPTEVAFKGTSTLQESDRIFNLYIPEGLIDLKKKDNELTEINGHFVESNLIGKVEFIGDFEKETSKLNIDWKLRKLDLKNISTFVSNYVESLSGSVTGKGRINASPIGMSVNAFISGDGITAKAETWDVKNLSFKNVNFLYPEIITAGKQKISIREATLGKEFSNTEIVFELLSMNKIKLHSLRTDVESAELKITESTLTREPFDFTPFKVTVENWPLQKFMALLYKHEVAATGNLDGSIQLGKKNGVPVIEKGLLKTQKKGRVKVRPAGLQVDFNSVPSNPKAILDNYLWDFRYDDLEMDFSSNEKYEMKLTLRAFGRNKKYLDGKPLKLSVNFDLNIKDTIRSLLLTYDLPKKIEQRIYEEMQ